MYVNTYIYVFIFIYKYMFMFTYKHKHVQFIHTVTAGSVQGEFNIYNKKRIDGFLVFYSEIKEQSCLNVFL